MNDIEIARSAQSVPIEDIAQKLGIDKEYLEPYGRDKAKLSLNLISPQKANQSKLVLVTAISPTPAGEGKTTVSVGLADALSALGEKASVALREPSLGPVFGIKGGAAGGGYSQVIPMEDINLHFTGDFSAIEKANNLLAALIDNVIHHNSNTLNIDPRSVVWKRVMDMNDRSLRQIITGLGGKAGGVPTQTGFNITAASEIMAILSLSKDFEDLKKRIDSIYVADTYNGAPVFVKDLGCTDAMAILLKDAIKPNLVQTLEGTPAFIHAGPFANIAQGTNSLIATKMAMSLSDFVITEAGFGADLGAEKFMNLKARAGELKPAVVVLVATVRALKYHGGASLNDLHSPNPEALHKGFANLDKHIENLQSFGQPVIVALNAFSQDTKEEHNAIFAHCKELGVAVELSEGWAKGGKGVTELAEQVRLAAQQEVCTPAYTYELEDSIQDKIAQVASNIYGAKAVEYSPKALKQLARIEGIGLGGLPICIAKTQKSFSDDERRIGRPRDFHITIREFEIASGAGFIIPITGSILRMPGLPSTPAAYGMSIDASGNMEGLS